MQSKRKKERKRDCQSFPHDREQKEQKPGIACEVGCLHLRPYNVQKGEAKKRAGRRLETLTCKTAFDLRLSCLDPPMSCPWIALFFYCCCGVSKDWPSCFMPPSPVWWLLVPLATRIAAVLLYCLCYCYCYCYCHCYGIATQTRRLLQRQRQRQHPRLRLRLRLCCRIASPRPDSLFFLLQEGCPSTP